jgi:ankyrin repeat domain-containing protein 50
LETLIVALKSVLEASAESFIILDALDECSRTGRSREQLCEILAEISKWSIPHSHVLVTGRKEPDIEDTLSEIKNLVKLPIQNAEVDMDIRVYVRSQMAKDAKLSRWANKVGKIETTLVEKADGMYEIAFVLMPWY